MEAIKTRLKTIAWFLTVLMLFQSCVVYHKTPTTLEKASREQIKTKVTNTDGITSNYRYITYEDGDYYGVKKKSGELVKTPLNEQEIAEVVLTNKTASTWLTVGVIALPVIAVVVIAATAEFSSGSTFGGI